VFEIPSERLSLRSEKKALVSLYERGYGCVTV
jgi:hypothetical protein